MEKNALSIENLYKNYESVKAVQNVSLDITPGEIFGLLGPNGAGKTSIISIITTLEKPSSGTAKVFGVDVTKEPMAAKRLTGVVHQEIVNSGFFDVVEILEFISGYYGIVKNHEQINYVLNKLGLYEHRHKKVK
ncbi:MAG: ATP-binding cassette domain-containing protein, partial [Bdellovibrionales bacterium]|nr:ATP-binding cassette domain-containing protein [Bdellovibrionales bacterium]